MARAVGLLTALALILAPAPARGSTLVHWWKADGDAADFIATNHGTLAGDTAFVAGHSGQAFSFDGDDDRVVIPDDPSHYPAGSFAVDGWARTTVPTGPGQIITHYECAGLCGTIESSSVWEIEIRDGRGWGYIRDTNGVGPVNGGQLVTGGPLINDGQFHQVALIRDVDAGKLALYVDGVVAEEQDLVVAGAFANADGDADPATMGAQLTGGSSIPAEELTGAVDDVRFWDGAEYPDKTGPVVTPVVTGPAGNGGWYRGDTTVSWTVTDESVVRSSTGCGPTTLTTDTAGAGFTCSASSAGGSGSSSVTVKRDATAPTVTCPAAPKLAQGATGATLTATVADALSGPAATAVTVALDTTTAGARTAAVTGADAAGNTTTAACAYTVEEPLPATPAVTTVPITQIATLPPAKVCVSRRKFRIHLRNVKTKKIVRAEIKLNAKLVRKVKGKALGLPIDLRGLPKGTVRVVITVTDVDGVKRVGKRTYHTCVPGKKKT